MIEWLSNNAGVTGLLFFFTAFLSVAYWAFRPSAKEQIESYKNIPLNDQERAED